MDRDTFKRTLEIVKKNSQKRKFSQSFDLIVNLKDLNIKNPEHQLDFFVTLPFTTGKKRSVCALVGLELKESAKACDQTVLLDDFPGFEGDKKKIRHLSKKHAFFIAQATIMPQVAKVFGKSLGTKGKMPNPKAGCVVPPNANLTPLYEKLQKTLRITAKVQPVVKCRVGTEDMDDKEVLDNIMAIFNQIIHHLPNERNNIKNVYLKVTMGKPVKLGSTQESAEQPKKVKPKAQPEKKPEKAEEKKEETK